MRYDEGVMGGAVELLEAPPDVGQNESISAAFLQRSCCEVVGREPRGSRGWEEEWWCDGWADQYEPG
jgi:hypothetical protein